MFKTIYITILTLFLFSPSCLSANSSEILQNLNLGNYEKLRQMMFSSSGADSLFLIAIFESDGYKATVQFQNIWEQYRSHLLAWESLQRLYEYSLALGDEEQAETLKRKLKSRPAESLPQNLNVKSCFFWVQTGAFSSEANALGQKQKLTNLGYCAIIIDQVIEGKKLKVVRAGSYATKNEAEQASKAIAKKLRIKPRVVSEGL